jgi:uncharacterized membrane protein
MIASPSEIGVEEIVVNSVLWLKLFIEAIGALVIGIGMILAGFRFMRGAFPPAARDFIDVRLTLARFLAIALEFQLGADILSTAVAPSWEAIGKLAAIAVIRTALNYFLSRDMQEECIGRDTDQSASTTSRCCSGVPERAMRPAGRPTELPSVVCRQN